MQTATVEIKFRLCGTTWQYCSGMCMSCGRNSYVLSVRTLTEAEYEKRKTRIMDSHQ